MKPTFWMILGSHVPIFRHTTRHTTEESARKEAERLAMVNPEQTFVVLEAIASVVKTEVQWEQHHPEADLENPF